MKVKVERLTNWSLALDVARETMGQETNGKEPSSGWKKRMLLARHSPIQTVFYRIDLVGIPYWVSVHLVRHKVGVDHFVRSQRSDRTGVSRDELPQNAPVVHTMVANAQAILAISRKRLCFQASPETRKTWEAVVKALAEAGEVELAEACVPECVACGGMCPELKPCGRRPTTSPEHRRNAYDFMRNPKGRQSCRGKTKS